MKRIVSLLFIFIIFALKVQADVVDLLDSVSVEIEQKGDNPSVAKDKAIEIAARFAFKDALMMQLDCHAKIDSITNDQISNCLYEYVIENEKYSASVYIAKITYQFNYRLVAQLLRNQGISFSEKIVENSEKPQKKNVNKQRILMRTEDFINAISKKTDFDYRIEKIAKKRIILNINSEKLLNIKVPYLILK